jgi:uncharacterized protein YqgC (DUF456 family)
MSAIVVISGLFMVVGLIGVVLPVLPGLLLVWVGVLLWTLAEDAKAAWWVLGVVTALYAVGVVVEYLVPGQRMRRAGVRTGTLVLAVLLAIVLGILIPVVGALLGFPLGIYLLQRVRRGSHEEAVRATGHALRAIGLNILIELCTALLMITTWALALWMT